MSEHETLPCGCREEFGYFISPDCPHHEARYALQRAIMEALESVGVVDWSYAGEARTVMDALDTYLLTPPDSHPNEAQP